jgi:hypothetical protein
MVALGFCLLLPGAAVSAPAAGPEKPSPPKSSATINHKKMKPAQCLMTLSKAASFDTQAGGEGAASQNFREYLKAKEIIATLPTADLTWLLENGTPAGRLYAAVLLWECGRVSKELSFGKLLTDKDAVRFRSGCEIETTSVKTIAQAFNDKNQYLDFKLSPLTSSPL